MFSVTLASLLGKPSHACRCRSSCYVHPDCTHTVHSLYNSSRLFLEIKNISLFVFEIGPVKVWIMDNVIVKDNKASRESLATGNSEITRTENTSSSPSIETNHIYL